MRTTEKLFWADAYTRDFEARVLSVDGPRVVLDRTAFNPRGGGLVSDTGTVGGMRVEEVLRQDEDIVHVVTGDHRLEAGNAVRCSLDWERRYRVMKMHTSAHILSSVVNRETGALITGNQITPEESRVDFSLEQFDRDKITSYVDEVNGIIARGIAVTSYFLKREEAAAIPGLVKLAKAAPPSVDVLRIVQIGDVDTQADGGVHVKNTSEIGRLVGLRAENKGRSNRRLYFTVA
ncbi:MAG TPA: alanyl-tRNA editing protein [Nitrososphaerales archaeon]|nr:alanyl-tRNA editing protein [Nitrososphaerales archaeon]